MRLSTGAILRVTVPATIMRSLCRGLGRKTSAPKRAISKREVLAAIISMAQQARPNVSGQMDDSRAQLNTWSTLLARPRRPHLQLVRDRSIAAHAARGPGRHMDRALEYFFRIRRRPCGAQYCRQLQHQHPGQCAHRADRVPPAAPVAL